jgi:hypothetical protein
MRKRHTKMRMEEEAYKEDGGTRRIEVRGGGRGV